MAKEITVRQMSGKEDSFKVTPRTVRVLKRQLHGWPCEDESKRNMSSVEVVVGDRPQLNNKELVSKAIAGANVLAFGFPEHQAGDVLQLCIL